MYCLEVIQARQSWWIRHMLEQAEANVRALESIIEYARKHGNEQRVAELTPKLVELQARETNLRTSP